MLVNASQMTKTWIMLSASTWYDECIQKLEPRNGKFLNLKGDYVEKKTNVCAKTCSFSFCRPTIIKEYLGTPMAKSSLLYGRPAYITCIRCPFPHNLICRFTAICRFEYGVRNIYNTLSEMKEFSEPSRMGGSPSELSEELVTYEKRKKGWRMNCDVGNNGRIGEWAVT